ncbi:hypothetical protein D9619_000176 [Psilocybe cf. subviscida]|uniref:Uncharacterized protein n=1 Tax=Psilocybe cf. subviscida TaxID=2480587 RepID=A0A8H5BFM5_9AGAR|nr:hypothetical protein D9619_000176 [Psilocybe cf. subviscida]
MHASLRDFLLDPSRSNIFCINMQTRAVGIVCRAIELLEGGTALTVPRCLIPLITILSYYSESMRDDDEGFRIYSLVSNFNVVETVLCKIDADLIDDELASALKSYIDWLLEESEYTSDPLRALLQPTLAQIKTWLVNQFDKLDFHNLNNTEQIDVWPFFTPYCIDFGDGYPTSVSENLSSALKICGSSPSCHRDLRGTRFNLSNRTAVLCFLLPHLVRPSDSDYSLTPGSDSWLMESDFLGRHAMSRERYGTALQRVIYYLLQLPEAVLLKILHVSDSKKAILFTPIMRLIRAILHTFFYRSPCTTDLYFLVALASPVLRKVGMVDDISGYTYGALTEFPFLNNTTDLDYIRAKRQVEEACIKRKIKTSLRELVERMGLTGMQSVAYKELLGSFAGIDKRAPQSS